MIEFEVKSKTQPIGKRKGQTVYFAQPVSQQHLTNKMVVDRIVRETSLSAGDVSNALISLGAIVRDAFEFEERNNIWNTPYLFNAKEFDEETGLYYYGARYYEPKVSLWISVDKLSEEDLKVSSYCYTDNNPIKYLDPDGNKKHNWIKESTTNKQSLDARYNNASFQKRFTNGLVQIWAHGLRKDMRHRSWGIEVSVDYYKRRVYGNGYFHFPKRDEEQIDNAKMLVQYLNKYDKNWRSTNGGHPIIILHHYCPVKVD